MLEQRTDAWHQIRLGRVTASKVADVLATTRSGPAASRDNYKAELVAERLTGTPTAGFVNSAMMRGTELEPLARDCYAFLTGNTVVEEAFVHHPRIDMAGCSPDGLIGDDGLVEIKCVGTAKHIALLKGAKPEDRYIKQVLWQMACTGRQWADLAYYDDRLPVEMQMHVVRIDRDDAAIADMEAKVEAFLEEVNADVLSLTNLYLTKEAA